MRQCVFETHLFHEIKFILGLWHIVNIKLMFALNDKFLYYFFNSHMCNPERTPAFRLNFKSFIALQTFERNSKL